MFWMLINIDFEREDPVLIIFSCFYPALVYQSLLAKDINVTLKSILSKEVNLKYADSCLLGSEVVFTPIEYGN